VVKIVKERLNNNFTIYDCFFLRWSVLLISQVALAIFFLRALPSTKITDSKCRIYFFNVPKPEQKLSGQLFSQFAYCRKYKIKAAFFSYYEIYLAI
jgi:hypothetical protein